MREFYKNPKSNTLKHIVYVNKTRQLPYLKIVPRNMMKFRKSKRGNILRYSYKILPNNEYRRFSSKSIISGKVRRYHMFSCIYTRTHIVKRIDSYVDDVSSLDKISKCKIHNLNYISKITREAK